MANQVRIGVGVSGAKGAASEVDKLRDKFDRLQKQGAKGFAIGVGAAATTMAFNAMGNAIGNVSGFLSDSKDAFRENEVSVNQLNASLRANVSGWAGHTAAINEAITAGQKLAFDDELQREALTKLVGAYGDVTAALESERLAMDLARFSGMGLLEASQILINVHAGNFRSLRQLGISTKDVKTETEALGLIYEKVGGQAAAYAETDLGKVEAANIRIEESQERIGESLSRVGTVALPIFADALEGSVDALGHAGRGMGLFIEDLQRLKMWLTFDLDALEKFNKETGKTVFPNGKNVGSRRDSPTTTTAPATTTSPTTTIPHGADLNFDEGGVVPGPTGQPRLAVVHGGEEVLTPQQRGGTTVILNVQGNLIAEDKEAVVRELMRAAAFVRG